MRELFNIPGQGAAKLYTIRGGKGLTAEISDFGATIVSITTPDKNGKPTEVTLRYGDDADWLTNKVFFGATCGRVCNRIAGGEFELEGKRYELYKNDGPNNLHGGKQGYSHRLWTLVSHSDDALELSLDSPDGEEGFPAALAVKVRFSITQDNGLAIRFSADSDGTTLVNLTNHTYFNLSGIPGSSIGGHTLKIASGHYLPADKVLIPTGELRAVEGTPFDFTTEKRIDADFANMDEQMSGVNGYDHNFVLDKADEPCVTLHCPESGITMEVLTDQPGVQLYTGNALDGTLKGPGGAAYGSHSGVCLETQRYPDAPHHAHFPSIVLKKGEHYEHNCLYRFL